MVYLLLLLILLIVVLVLGFTIGLYIKAVKAEQKVNDIISEVQPFIATAKKIICGIDPSAPFCHTSSSNLM